MSPLLSLAPLFELVDSRAPRRDRSARILRWLTGIALAWLVLAPRVASAQADLPAPNPHDPISSMAQHANHWTEGSYDVWVLSGNCLIAQGALTAHCNQAVMWVDRTKTNGAQPQKVITYLEGNVLIDFNPSAPPGAGAPASVLGAAAPADAQFPSRLSDEHWFGRLYSFLPPSFHVPPPEPEPAAKPAVYLHAVVARQAETQSGVQQAQFAETIPPPAVVPVPLGNRRIRAFPRTDLPVQIQWVPSAGGNEWTAIVTSGVNLIIDGLPQFGSVDVSTDRLVLWTTGQQQPNLAGGHVQSENTPLEIYMEGNVVFRQGERLVQAQSMYFDANQQIGVVLNGEILTPLPVTPDNKIPGIARVRGNVLRQVGEDRYTGQDVSFTTSRLGDPSFEIRSQTGTYVDTQTPVVDPVTGQPMIDPRTGAPRINHDERFTGTNNVLYAEGVPVFYWPYVSLNLEKGSILKEFEIKTDSVFGTQVLTTLDVYQLLGVQNEPKGTTWEASLDYLSLRGFGGGTEYHYDTDHFFAVPGKTQGMLNAWFIDDHGIDDLGLDRRAITPESDFRGRLLAQHREQLPDDWQISGEVGYQATRNFLEEYFQREWDTYKDESTDLEIRRNVDNMSFTITAAVRVDDFFTETDRLPQLDHFWIAQPLLQDTLTWYEHSSGAYLSQGHATTPTDPTDAAKFTLLPWESPTGLQGSRFATRQELDYPFQLGPVKVVPFALGEVAHWDEDLDHNDLNRAYGVAGIRASMPMWAIDPTIQLPLLNVNGVAHKIDFNGDFSISESSSNLNELPLYDQLNDDSIQHFERRFEFNTFGPFGLLGIPTANLPLQFDPRYYALRRGSDEWVTGPTEIAGDQTVLRLDVDQRWQTKRGPPGDEHIIDWITLDTQVEIFPDAKQNYGSNVGLATYDFHWFVGDRVTVVSTAADDFFSGGQRMFTIGAFLNRPPRGSFYVGFYSLEGPFRQESVTTSYVYRMTPKWAVTFSDSFNVVPNADLSLAVGITRISESFLMTLGVNSDASRGTVGASFMLEPRGFGKTSLSRRGLDIPPAGTSGLE
jgi:hypothetical protein